MLQPVSYSTSATETRAKQQPTKAEQVFKRVVSTVGAGPEGQTLQLLEDISTEMTKVSCYKVVDTIASSFSKVSAYSRQHTALSKFHQLRIAKLTWSQIGGTLDLPPMKAMIM